MMEEKRSVLDLIKKSLFIIRRTENPDPEEIRKVARITASFMLMLGITGMVVAFFLNIVK